MRAKYIKGTPEERFWPNVDKNGPVPRHHPELGPCWVWTAGKYASGYGCFFVGGVHAYAHRYAFETEIGGLPDGYGVDHVCNNRSCVRVSHMRVATKAENNMNQTPRANTQSGYKGVHWCAFTNKWRAVITARGVTHHLGRFTDLIMAAEAYKEASVKYHGKFANNGGVL